MAYPLKILVLREHGHLIKELANAQLDVIELLLRGNFFVVQSMVADCDIKTNSL